MLSEYNEGVGRLQYILQYNYLKHQSNIIIIIVVDLKNYYYWFISNRLISLIIEYILASYML